MRETPYVLLVGNKVGAHIAIPEVCRMAEFLIGVFAFMVAVLLMGIGILAGRGGIRGGCSHAGDIPGVGPACRGACPNASEKNRCLRKSSAQP